MLLLKKDLFDLKMMVNLGIAKRLLMNKGVSSFLISKLIDLKHQCC